MARQTVKCQSWCNQPAKQQGISRELDYSYLDCKQNSADSYL